MFLITQFTMEHMNHRIALQLNCQLMEILFTSLGYNWTYDRQYTSEILKLVEYLHTPLKFVGLN